MPSIINATTASGLTLTPDNSGTLQLATNNGTVALAINASQGVQVLNCLGVGNATPSTSGAGITFPATFSASADANTLDDYEEGSFPPIVLGSSNAGTFTYTTGNTWGRYVKVGPLVNFQLSVQTSAGSGATGNVLVDGLPFTVRNFTNYFPSATVGFFTYATSGWQQYDQSVLITRNATTLNLYYTGNTGSIATDAGAINGASLLYITGSYLTDS